MRLSELIDSVVGPSQIEALARETRPSLRPGNTPVLPRRAPPQRQFVPSIDPFRANAGQLLTDVLSTGAQIVHPQGTDTLTPTQNTVAHVMAPTGLPQIASGIGHLNNALRLPQDDISQYGSDERRAALTDLAMGGLPYAAGPLLGMVGRTAPRAAAAAEAAVPEGRVRLYHGSPTSGIADELRPSENGLSGPGIYTSRVRDEAGSYGNNIYRYDAPADGFVDASEFNRLNAANGNGAVTAEQLAQRGYIGVRDGNTHTLFRHPNAGPPAADSSLPRLRGASADPGGAAAAAAGDGFDTSRTLYRGLNRPYDPTHQSYYQMFTSSADDAREYGQHVLEANIRPGRSLRVNGGGNNFNTIYVGQLPEEVQARLPHRRQAASTDEIAHAAREAGYDSVSFENVHDNKGGEIRYPVSDAPLGRHNPQEIDDLYNALNDGSFGWENAPIPQRVPARPIDASPRTVTAVFNHSNIRPIGGIPEPATRLPVNPTRELGRASDGSVLPVRRGQPFRQAEVGGSGDLREAAGMSAPEAPFANSADSFRAGRPGNPRAYANEANEADVNLRRQLPQLQQESQALFTPHGIADLHLRENGGNVDAAIQALRDSIEWRRSRAPRSWSDFASKHAAEIAADEEALRILERRPRFVPPSPPSDLPPRRTPPAGMFGRQAPRLPPGTRRGPPKRPGESASSQEIWQAHLPERPGGGANPWSPGQPISHTATTLENVIGPKPEFLRNSDWQNLKHAWKGYAFGWERQGTAFREEMLRSLDERVSRTHRTIEMSGAYPPRDAQQLLQAEEYLRDALRERLGQHTQDATPFSGDPRDFQSR